MRIARGGDRSEGVVRDREENMISDGYWVSYLQRWKEAEGDKAVSLIEEVGNALPDKEPLLRLITWLTLRSERIGT